jgi:Na+-transporting methylmalonyl-CoA/oxaloacetate decarboxylase gamma subunit
MNNILLALEITAVGMGLVFGAIVVLWGLMVLLTALIRDKEPASDSLEPAPVIESGFKAQAAAVAVAIALAEQETSTAHPLPPPPTSLISAWQLGMRTRQMYEKGKLR